jgi:hypothetical protein
MEENKSPVRIVVLYARKDGELLDELKKHLSPLIRSRYVETWDDRDILAGTEWSAETDARLKTAHIILLLVSPDFIASDYYYSVEMMQALARHEKGDAYVLPIILRSVEWKETTPLGKLRSLPSDGKPIKDSNRGAYIDEAFADVARGIKRVVEEVRARFLRSEHMMKLFVSCSLRDRDSVRELVENLRRKAEYYIWMDQEKDEDQHQWERALDHIEECECFVLFLTPRYEASASCAAQLQYALALRKMILPLIWQPCTIPESLWSISHTDISILSSEDAFLYIIRALTIIETKLAKRGYAAQVKAPRPAFSVERKAVFASSSDSDPGANMASSLAQVEVSIQEEANYVHHPSMQPDDQPGLVSSERPVTFIANDRRPMRLIPASKFLFGDGQMLELPDFYIDAYPVTNGEYLRFIVEQNIIPPTTWRGKKFSQNKVDHPVTGVTWYEAMAYAKWAGKRLPTAAEWEKAARGSDGRRYPWGEVFDVQHCNTLESRLKVSTPVTQHQSGASVYGVLDMAGNVWEWTTDEVEPRRMGRQNQETKRVLKGGSWNTPKGSAECAMYTSAWPHERLPDGGFRCVLSIE